MCSVVSIQTKSEAGKRSKWWAGTQRNYTGFSLSRACKPVFRGLKERRESHTKEFAPSCGPWKGPYASDLSAPLLTPAWCLHWPGSVSTSLRPDWLFPSDFPSCQPTESLWVPDHRFSPEDESSKILWNTGFCLLVHTASKPKRASTRQQIAIPNVWKAFCYLVTLLWTWHAILNTCCVRLAVAITVS